MPFENNPCLNTVDWKKNMKLRDYLYLYDYKMTCDDSTKYSMLWSIIIYQKS